MQVAKFIKEEMAKGHSFFVESDSVDGTALVTILYCSLM